MKKFQAPHEKITEQEIKEEIEKLLSNHLKFRNRWNISDLGIYEPDFDIHEFDEFMKNQESSIFKLRRHFCPEKTTIMQITLGELSNILGEINES